MNNKSDFAQILSEKLRNPESNKHEKTAQSTLNGNNDYLHLAYLIGHIDSFYFKKGLSYKNQNTQPRFQSKPKTQAVTHTFNELQMQALAFYRRFKCELGDSFTSAELKKAFRSLARLLHPDSRSGNAAHFIELKQHTDALSILFQKTK